MALAKNDMPRGHSYYMELLEEGGGGMHKFEEADKCSGGINMSRSSSLSSPSSTNSNNHLYCAMNYHQHEEGQSVISFKGGFNNNNFVNTDDGSVLSFDQDDYNNLEQFPNRRVSNIRLLESFNSFQAVSRTVKGKNYEELFGWINSEGTTASDSIDHELIGTDEPCFHKRPQTGESMQTLKKQCTGANRKPKPKATTQSSKDPQSIAAKNRRERISERLKILQDLVPNGSKVDLVTMLEKAISYVKFLQLQVKVLATDELWPVQGGKAPELSQVKDAIDAILASQRDANSSSK